MTAAARDAVRKPTDKEPSDMCAGNPELLLHADDNLLIGRHQHSLHHLLDRIAAGGADVGMELHWDTFPMVRINSVVHLRTPAGI
eukprot:2808642-Pyramimonas_sp.AAC.1